jgi:uncharacterized membrane protein YbhN (UPF0104 family)
LQAKELGANPIAPVKPVISAVIGFVFEIGVLFWLLQQWVIPFQSIKCLLFLLLLTLFKMVGLTIIGFTEIVMTSILTFLGIPVDYSFSVTLLARIVTLWFRLIVSYLPLQWIGKKTITKKITQFNLLNSPLQHQSMYLASACVDGS